MKKESRPKTKVTTRLSHEWLLWLLLCGLTLVLHLQQPFERQFIKYDDHHFVEPMLKLTVKEYFEKWLPDRALIGLPVRDLIFMGEYEIGNALGFNVFIFFTLGFFLASVFLMSKIFEKAGISAFMRWSVLFIWVSHPLLVEVLQWIWIQKLVLAFWFLMLAAKFVFDHYLEGKSLTKRGWGYITALWLLSLGCWPTGLLWPVFPLFLFWSDLSRPFRRALLMVYSVLAGAYFMYLTSGTERDYRRAGESIYTNLERTFDFGINSIGRGFYNLFFPHRLSMYYNLHSSLNIWGLLVAVLFCAIVIWGFRKNIFTRFDKKFLLLAGVLFAPQCLPFLGYSTFIWADRYTYVILPALILIVLQILRPQFHSASTYMVMGAIMLGYAYLTYQRVPDWRDDLRLAQSCADNEGAAYCEFLVVEKKQDRGGCGASYADIEKYSQKYRTYENKYDFYMRDELPFYNAVCMASVQGDSLDSRLDEVGALFNRYNDSPHLLVGMIMLQMEARQYDQAIKLFQQLSRRTEKDGVSTYKLSLIYAGLVRGICELSRSKECERIQADFGARTALNERGRQTVQYQYGYNLIRNLR